MEVVTEGHHDIALEQVKEDAVAALKVSVERTRQLEWVLREIRSGLRADALLLRERAHSLDLLATGIDDALERHRGGADAREG